MGGHSSEKLRFDVYTVCLVYTDELPKGYNFAMNPPKLDDLFYCILKLKYFQIHLKL